MNKMDVLLSVGLLALFSFNSSVAVESESCVLQSGKKIASVRPAKKQQVKKTVPIQAPDKQSEGSLVTVSSKQEFEKLLASGKPMIVDVSIPGCPACKVVAPKIKQLAQKRGDVIVAKVDASKLNFIRSKYKLTAFPTFLYFKDGQLVSKMVGGNSVAGFEKQLKSKLGV